VKRFISTLTILLGFAMPAQSGTIALVGDDAGEASGDGWALLIPNLKASSPGVYVPVQVAPFEPFDIGTITWNDGDVSSSGAVQLAVTDEMCSFNFAPYVEEVVRQLAVIGQGGADVVLSNIAGPGLSFQDGVLESIDFTADVSWTPTLNGFPSAEPYNGTVSCAQGVFTWDLSDAPKNWFIGANDVDLIFDLTAVVKGLARRVGPTLALQEIGGSYSVGLNFALPSTSSFCLESSPNLKTPTWTQVGSSFAGESAPGSISVDFGTATSLFYRVRRVSP